MTSIPRYGLQQLYAAMREAARANDWQRLSVLVDRVTGIRPQARPPGLTADRTVRRLTYGGFKPAELAMLAANLKPVVKLEDIPVRDGKRFVRRYREHYEIIISEPYFKDRLLLRTRLTGSAHEGPLVTLYVSRGDQGRALFELERGQPDDVTSAGAILGFPPCCVSAFHDTMSESRHDQDTVNDDAIRKILAATASTPGHPLLDPLSDRELLAFYPCSPQCEEATRFATRTLTALRHASESDAAAAERDLGRPCLFWRAPFFVLFDASACFQEDGALTYQRALLHTFADPNVMTIQLMFGGAVLPQLCRGNRVKVDAQGLRVWRDRELVWELESDAHLPPILARWS